ncbi:MAG: PASTA domain-containing protein, partial [Synergistes sp.]|nr:PASTA domain-containing protein [Synergistes sp.]
TEMGKFHKFGIAIALITIIVCAFVGIKLVFMDDKNTKVPSVTGMHAVDAADTLQKCGLLAKIDKVDSTMPSEMVVSQNIPAGEHVARGEVILLRVSKGGMRISIPDVRTMKFEDGVKTLSEAGFKVAKVTRVTDKEKAPGIIIAQNPSSPQQVPENCMVSLLVSSGTGSESSFVAVPDLLGKDRQNAEELLVQLGLKLGTVSEAPSDSAPIGTVMSTRPRTGAKIPIGAAVNITLARETLEGEVAPEKPNTSAEDKEREETVKRVVVKEAVPTSIPTKIPEIKKTENTQKTESTKATTAVKQPASATTQVPKETKTTAAQPEAKPKEEQKPVQKANTKSAKVRYQVPPLAKPLSLKIEITDANGTRTLKDGVANSGEYISMNVPYAGEAKITIFLGGDFVWQDRYN